MAGPKSLKVLMWLAIPVMTIMMFGILAADQEALKAADAEFKKGVKHYNAMEWSIAEKHFLSSFEIYNHSMTAYNLGCVYVTLEKPVKAQYYASLSLSSPPPLADIYREHAASIINWAEQAAYDPYYTIRGKVDANRPKAPKSSPPNPKLHPGESMAKFKADAPMFTAKASMAPPGSSKRKIALQSDHSGQYVRAGVGSESYLAASSPHIKAWEIFVLTKLTDGNYTLQSAHSFNYVQVLPSGSYLAANATTFTGTEKFRMIDLGDDKIALESIQADGKYVRAGVGKGSYMAAVSPHIMAWETFRIINADSL